MSKVFQQVNSNTGHKASLLYLRDRSKLDDLDLQYINGLTVAYDLVLLNRETEVGRFGQVILEFGYSVTNYKDQFDRNVGKRIALENLNSGGAGKSNYSMVLLGLGYDAEAIEHLNAEGVFPEIPQGSIPLRLVNKENPFPWILQRDFNLTGLVQSLAINHFLHNPVYS